jgi:hypothetical protein
MRSQSLIPTFVDPFIRWGNSNVKPLRSSSILTASWSWSTSAPENLLESGVPQLTASDMLTVINVLNALGDETAAGEGEAALTSIPAPRAQPSAAPLPSPAPAFDVPLRTA